MRVFWLLLGVVALVAAVAGVVLPLVPTTPFLLVAVFAFSRSSPRLEAWLLDHPRLGPPIRAWRQKGAIARRAKVVAVAMMSAPLVVSLVAGVPPLAFAAQAVVLAAAAAFVVTRPEPD